MSKRLIPLCGVALFVFCSFAVVEAQQPPSVGAAKSYNNYFVFKGGMYYPEGDLKDLNAGFNGEIAYGLRFHPNFAVEIATGYLQAGKTESMSVLGYGVSVDANVYAIPITLAIKGIIPIDKTVELYGIAGGGGYYVNGSLTATVTGVGRGSFNADDFVVGGFLGAGITYNITPQWFVGLEGKYLWLTKASLSDTVAGVPINADFKLEGVQGTVNIGYRF